MKRTKGNSTVAKRGKGGSTSRSKSATKRAQPAVAARARTGAQPAGRAKAGSRTGAAAAQHRGHGAMERHAGRHPAPAAKPLPRDPKGGRAQFYQDPAIDQLWAVVTALTGEVSVAFDRLDTVERLLERDGTVTRAAIEAWRPDEDAAAERAQRREELIARVFQVLSQYGS